MMRKSGIIKQCSHAKVLLEIILSSSTCGERLIEGIRLCWWSRLPLDLILRRINVLILLKILSIGLLVHGC